MSIQQTVDRPLGLGHVRPEDAPPLPGLIVVWSGDQPRYEAIPFAGHPLTLGRGNYGGLPIDDACMSRSHAEVSFHKDRFVVRDLGSRNGTAVDGEALRAAVDSPSVRVIRTGDTLALLLPNLRAYLGRKVDLFDDAVVGPILGECWSDIASLAERGDTLHITGETGSGKELAARAFHLRGPRAKGPFVAVNCATIPPAIAERLLFGTKRGAYSGADADSEGYVQAAHEGTLFLDEIAELDAAVQAKLLRLLESREVLPLGATKARPVDLRICSATFGSLSDAVAEKRFREDLYYRVARPSVSLPSLRERREEIPWLAARVLRSRPAHVSLIERALLLPWRGNVRELLVELREADRRAEREGSATVEARHLPQPPAAPSAPAVTRASPREAMDRETIEAALATENGNVARTARALGVHRTQLRRWMDKHGIVTQGVAHGSDDAVDDI